MLKTLGKDIIRYLSGFLDLKSLNSLIKTNKLFSEYKKITHAIQDGRRVCVHNTNNIAIQEIIYWENGKPERIMTYFVDCKHYYQNGLLYSHYHFNDKAQLHGESRDWYDNGQLLYLSTYLNNELHGECKTWYRDGTLRSQSHFRHGWKHGLCTEYHSDGTITTQKRYVYDLVIMDCHIL